MIRWNIKRYLLIMVCPAVCLLIGEIATWSFVGFDFAPMLVWGIVSFVAGAAFDGLGFLLWRRFNADSILAGL